MLSFLCLWGRLSVSPLDSCLRAHALKAMAFTGMTFLEVMSPLSPKSFRVIPAASRNPVLGTVDQPGVGGAPALSRRHTPLVSGVRQRGEVRGTGQHALHQLGLVGLRFALECTQVPL